MVSKILKGEMTKRVRNLKERIVDNPPHLSTERLKFLKEVYKETEGEPALIKRARLFEKHLTEMTIFIDENPIVGSITEYPVGIYPQPEYTSRWMLKQDQYQCQLGNISYTKEDRKWLEDSVHDWQDKCVLSKSKEILSQALGRKSNVIEMLKAGVATEFPYTQPRGVTLDYAKVLIKGIKGVIEEVNQEIAKLRPGIQEDEQKRVFYHAVLICLNALIAFARRYASLAKEMVKNEMDGQRKRELEEIAEICQWIPENPARNFHEAIQSFCFTFLASHIQELAVTTVLGRFGQYLQPFYEKDKAEGNISEEEAIELLELLFIKLLGIQVLRSGLDYKGAHGQTNLVITLGGLTPEGEDATCDVDWLILETQRRVCCIQPTISVLIHDKMSQEFLIKCVEVIKETGLGQPAFLNNERAIQQLLYHYPGISPEEARGLVGYGCVQTRPAHATDPEWLGFFNMAKMLELALNNGRDPLTGVQVGCETGEAKAFGSYEELEKAVGKQFQYCFRACYQFGRIGSSTLPQIVPVPYHSALTDDCIRKGKDITEGGARYPYGTMGIPVGTIDLANSLAAIKKLVFEEKQLTLDELKKALENNFEGNGYAEIHEKCLRTPKYGNDDNYVDLIAKKLYNMFWEECHDLPDSLGRPSTVPEAFSVSTHFGLGERTGALPSGRKARVALADATVSAMPGTDTKGPTALIRSATKVIDTIKFGSNHLNMKFTPSVLKDKGGAIKLLHLVKTYMDLGGYHVQFNVISSDTLKDAQLHPENYRHLLVRVAGFSAYFVYLDKGVQDEIIKRTEVVFD